MGWFEVRVTVAAEAAEAVGGKLLEMGARGYVTEDLGPARALVAYFPGLAGSAPDPRQALEEFVARLPQWGLPAGPGTVEARPVDEADWRDQWKAYFHPRRVGRRLLIHPPWEKPGRLAPEDLAIEIDPGQAFGTGTHATTRGALELLEEAVDRAGPAPGVRRALDLGTGSGILAIAAARLGVPHVLAVDNDPVAVEAALANVRRNRAGRRVQVVLGDVFAALAGERGGLAPAGERHGPAPAGERGGPVDLVLANLTTDLVAAITPAAAAALRPGGFFVCAGVSAGEGLARVAEVARSAGFAELDRRTEEGWTSLLLRKGGGQSPRRAVFYTLGCKANLYDSAVMMEALRQAGWEVLARGEAESETAEEARAGEAERPAVDLCVINSCAVTARAEAKSRQLARKLKREHPGALVALVGCYPQVRREEAARTAGVDLVLGTNERERLAEVLVERGLAERSLAGPVGEPGPAAVPGPGAFAGERTRATVKVQEGCDQFCSYCIIPYARGSSRSRPAAEVLDEVAGLVTAGFKEVVLTGIHLGAWGADLEVRGPAPEAREAGSSATPRPHLADLVREVAAVPGLARVRLSSVEPTEVTDGLIELMATDRHVCRHLHVPLQSGSDRVLERMNRCYTASAYLAMVERIRRRVPLVGLTTDVMVGFPGETDEDFAATLETVRRARFSRLHVFRFSPRPGTPAATMPGQVEAGVKKARSEELIRLGRRLAREFHESLVGLTLEVLVERADAADPAGPADAAGATDPAGPARGGSPGEGLTDNYVRVTFRGAGVRANTLVPVTIERAVPGGVAGRLALTPRR